ncbi:MAG: DUF4248 domain-containing protein [Bacteroidia bacterium]|nr:DUF4248 domain-containing protein [Bacteroidia bacterium]
MTTRSFVVRCYSKQELATIYFKHTSRTLAVANLRRWMARCKELMAELEADNHLYNPYCKMLSAREVRLIVRHLGEPEVEQEE